MRRFLPILFAALMLSSAVSCHQETNTAPDTDSTALSIALLPVMDCLPFYVADSLGLFDSLGVNVRLCTYEAAMDADTAFQRGRADGIVTDLVKAVAWRSQGDSLRVIYSTRLHLSLVTAHAARIREAKSIKEKVIGITRNSALDYMADTILRENGMIPKDLNRPQINNIELRQRMVDQNQYDGALLPEPYAAQSVANGAKRILSSDDLPNFNPLLALVFRDSVILSRREELRLVLQACDRACDYINSHRELPHNGMARFLPLANAVEDSIVQVPAFAPSSLPPDSLLTNIRTWCRSRTLLGRDTTRVVIEIK